MQIEQIEQVKSILSKTFYTKMPEDILFDAYAIDAAICNKVFKNTEEGICTYITNVIKAEICKGLGENRDLFYVNDFGREITDKIMEVYSQKADKKEIR